MKATLRKYITIADISTFAILENKPLIAINEEQARKRILDSHFVDYRHSTNSWDREYYSNINEELFYTEA